MVEVYDDNGSPLIPDIPPGKGSFPASSSAAASVKLPHGAAPSSPVDGDMWTTTAGLFIRINGSTVGPFTRPQATFPFGYPSTSTATNLRLRGPGNNVIGSAANQGYYMTRPGSVIGISLVIDINLWMSGDVQAQARLNDASTLLTSTLTLSGIGNGQKTKATISAGTHTFVAGDVLQLRRSLINTPVGITTDDMQGFIEVEYD